MMRYLVLLALLGLSQAFNNPHAKHGRQAIVHLFEWKWNDIAAECERFLAPKGYAGVQISPPTESILLTSPWRPWWERYQPISYNLCSRSGNESELRDMITRCNNVGVNIYVDAVINHMCGAGGGEGTHSTCGTYFSAKKMDFPSIPFSGFDFNEGKCKSASGDIENYNDINQVNLHNLTPLVQHQFLFQEVIDMGGEAIQTSEYFPLGRVTEFKYGAKIGNVFRKWNGEKLSYTKNWGEGWGFMPDSNALVFIDNHDNQRGHGGGGNAILTFWDARIYKMAVAYMLAHPYGVARVMSSFRWNRADDWQGPPSHEDGSTKDVHVNADDTCEDGWVCEHRWRQITNMATFRNVVNGQPHSNWWDNGDNQVAFGRGNRGFIVFNNDDWHLDVTLNTGMPGGAYCDVISGQRHLREACLKMVCQREL
ncbi:pancreatic alpha-amylase 2a5-like [Oncorhynchus nerka]|uniref:pancreatic alpha-amylase 2a5-like n=1 Tax=Oncorhynchus nerka TaxID=8023 RepID=UPI0031B7F8D8